MSEKKIQRISETSTYTVKQSYGGYRTTEETEDKLSMRYET